MKEEKPHIIYFHKDIICQRVRSLNANLVESPFDSVFWRDVGEVQPIDFSISKTTIGRSHSMVVLAKAAPLLGFSVNADKGLTLRVYATRAGAAGRERHCHANWSGC